MEWHTYLTQNQGSGGSSPLTPTININITYYIVVYTSERIIMRGELQCTVQNGRTQIR